MTGTQRTRAQEVFLEYGPTPRLCVEYVRNPHELERLHSCREQEIAKLDLDSLLSTVHLDLGNDLSHTIILLKRFNADDLHKFTVEPITLSVNRLLKIQLMNKEKKERLRTFLETSNGRVEDSRRPPFRGIGAAPASGRGEPNADPNGEGSRSTRGKEAQVAAAESIQ